MQITISKKWTRDNKSIVCSYLIVALKRPEAIRIKVDEFARSCKETIRRVDAATTSEPLNLNICNHEPKVSQSVLVSILAAKCHLPMQKNGQMFCPQV